MAETIVVVGGGLAAAKAVAALRESGFGGTVILYAEEPHLPYERPPLSKGYLLGEQPLEKAFVHEASWYAEHDVDVRTSSPVTSLDLSARTVSTSEGSSQGYDRLLLATGASPRRLAMADDSGAPSCCLRSIEDSDRLKAAFAPGARIAVVGGGWIGLEAAAAARTAGADVTVLESLDLPLLRVLGPEVAEAFAALHRSHGVDLRTGVSVEAVEPDGDGAVLTLGDGATVGADLVVVGIGVVPNVGLAEAAGLDVDNGVLVNERLQTSDPNVFAAGDVANHDHPVLGRRIRVEHWDTAIGQGEVAGRNLAGAGEVYDRLPYFFTDQYDLGMEYVGSVGPDGPDETVVRGDTAGTFSAFWLREGRVEAGMHANDWDATDQIRRLVGTEVDVDRLRDDSVPLSEV